MKNFLLIFVSVSIIVTLAFWFYSEVQSNVAYSKIDNILKDRGFYNKIKKEKEFYNSKEHFFVKKITFKDQPDVEYEIIVFDKPTINNIFDREDYNPKITSRGYKNNIELRNKKQAPYMFDIK